MHERILSLISIEWENLKINERISIYLQTQLYLNLIYLFKKCNNIKL